MVLKTEQLFIRATCRVGQGTESERCECPAQIMMVGNLYCHLICNVLLHVSCDILLHVRDFFYLYVCVDFISNYVSFIFNTQPTASSTQQVSVKYSVD